MSLERPRSKRLKQCTISAFFGAPKKALRSDLSPTKQLHSRDSLILNGNPEVPNNIAASGKICVRTLNERTEQTKAKNETLLPVSSPRSALSDLQSNSTKKKSKIVEKFEQCSSERTGPNDSLMGDEPQCSAGRPSLNVDTGRMKDGNSSQCRSSPNGEVSPDTARESSPSTDHEDSSSNSNDSCCKVPILPLELEQEPGPMPPNLIRFPRDAAWQPGNLKSSAEHTVLVQTPFVPGEKSPPKPCPAKFTDVWDQFCVKMPYSLHSLYMQANGKQTPRWQVIEAALRRPIRSFYDLREAILTYNGAFSWDMEELEDVIEEMSRAERKTFFDTLLPAIIRLALEAPEICTTAPPLLRKGRTHSLTMSQLQAATFLACAFFSMFPRRNLTKPGSQFHEFPSINFHTLFNRCYRTKRKGCRIEKIRCILNYFQQVVDKTPEGTITFTRINLRCSLGWEESQQQFHRAFITSDGLIEDQGYGMLMVDFANRKVGGGVLRDGCVQEEILYLIYPELICARLFTEALDDNEALLVTGIQRFNQYEGYGDDFKWTGNVVDFAERDPWGRKYTQIVAIDALAHQGKRQRRQQFSMEKILRELSKAFCGFQTPGFPRSCIATGNWGCGAFGGDPRLKFLLQWMAASRARRDLMYFTFGNRELMCELRALQRLILEQNLKIGDLCLLLKQYHRLYTSNENNDCPMLSEYLFQNFNMFDSD